MDVVLLRQQLEERDKKEEELQEQLQELKGVNQYLKNEVKRLISERQEERLLASGFGDSLTDSWQSGLGLGAEVCFERLRLGGELTEERVSHQEQIEELQRRAEEQVSMLTKRAATLITGVLPVLGSSPASNGAESNGDGAAQGSQQTLHVSSSSPEIQQQVEQLLHDYMGGKMEEDAAVDCLSRLHCRVQLLTPPATQGQHAAAQNGGVSEQLKQAHMGVSTNRRRTAPEQGVGAGVVGMQGDADQQQQQQQQPSQRRLASSTSFTAPPAGIHDFTPSFGGYYSQFVLAEPEKLRRLITRASSQNPRATSMAERATGLTGDVQGNGEASNGNSSSSSSSSTWVRSWSLGSKLLSFGSSRFSGSGPAVKPDAATSAPTAPSPSLPAKGTSAAPSPSSQAAPAAPSPSSQAAPAAPSSPSVPAAAAPVAPSSNSLPEAPAVEKSAAISGADEKESQATQHSTVSTLPTSAPHCLPASAAQDAPPKPASPAPPAATTAHPENADGSVGGRSGSQPAEQTTARHPPAPAASSEPAPHPPSTAPAAPPPARVQSPSINLARSSSNSSSTSTAKASKGVAATGQGALSALRKSLEGQVLEEGQVPGPRELMDTAPTLDKNEDLWAQALPLSGQQGGAAMQLYKA